MRDVKCFRLEYKMTQKETRSKGTKVKLENNLILQWHDKEGDTSVILPVDKIGQSTPASLIFFFHVWLVIIVRLMISVVLFRLNL